MPPKPKHTREEIIAAGVEIIKERGMEALSSRELGVKLGTTARPIFTAFKNMDELQKEIQLEILHSFDEYGKKISDNMPGFEKVGIMVVSFAIEEPNLFKALFLQGSDALHSLEKHFKNIRSIVDICFADIRQDYDLTEEQTRFLFDQFWIYTFGIGALCEMNVYQFGRQEIIDRLNTHVNATLMFIKNSGIQI